MSFLKLALFPRTIVEAPATKYTERKTLGCCMKHPGVPLWKRTRLGGCKPLNRTCPFCEIEFCLEIEATDTAAKQKEAGKMEKLAKHYEKLSADFGAQTYNIEVLGEEFERIKSKLEKGAIPCEVINMRRVTLAIEDAMEEVKKRFNEQEEAAAAKEMFASDRVRALYDTIEEVKKTMVAFHGKSKTATEAANKVLQDTVAGLNNLAEKLDDKTFEWGEDMKEVREDLEFARAHIGSLQVDLRGAKVELSSEVRTAIRSFSLRSVILEDRLDTVEARVSVNEAEIESLKNRVAILEGAPQENRSEIESLKKQIAELRLERVPVIRAAPVDIDSSSALNTNEQAATSPSVPAAQASSVGSNTTQVTSAPTAQVIVQVPSASMTQHTAQAAPADQVAVQVSSASMAQVTAPVAPADHVNAHLSSASETQVTAQAPTDQFNTQVSSALTDQFTTQVSSSLTDQVPAQVSTALTDQVTTQAPSAPADRATTQVSSAVTTQVSSAPTDQVKTQVSSAPMDQVKTQVSSAPTDQIKTQVSSAPTDQVTTLVMWSAPVFSCQSDTTPVSSSPTVTVSSDGRSNTMQVPSPTSSSSPDGSSTARWQRPVAARRNSKIESCHVRASSSGLSKATNDVLELIRGLQSNYQKKSIVEKTMGSLRSCSSTYQDDSHARCNEPIQESELAVIVEIMRRVFPSSAVVQFCGCWSLSCLFGGNTSGQERLAHAGGIGAVAYALKRHSRNARIQWAGCVAIVDLVWNNQRNQRTIVTNQNDYYHQEEKSMTDGVGPFVVVNDNGDDDDTIIGKILECILGSMQRFPNNGEVQYYGCLAIGALSQNNSHYAKWIGKQGVELVLNTMERFSSSSSNKDEDVIASGCFALESMVGAAVENQERIKELDGLDFVRREHKNLYWAKSKLEDEFLPSLDNRFLFP